MPAFLFGLMLVFAVANWFAVELSWKRVVFVAKPGVMAALITWYSLVVGWRGAGLWFGLGLVFALLGDVLLLFPARWFLPGLFSFLLTQVFYAIGFNLASFPLHPLGLLILLCILGLDVWIYRQLVSTAGGRGMAVPLLVDIAALSLMTFSAYLCLLRPEWGRTGAWAAVLGASLFLLSDSLLAYNRFVAPTPHHDLLVMVTYHLAQIGITMGVMLQASAGQ